jgi:hypothetical protein
MAIAQSTSFIDGNLSQLWLQINQRRIALGQQPLGNQQIQTLWARGDGVDRLPRLLRRFAGACRTA